MLELFLFQHHHLQQQHQQLLRLLVVQHDEHELIGGVGPMSSPVQHYIALLSTEEMQAETFEVEDVSDPDLLLAPSSCTSCASTSCCSTTSCALCSCLNPWA